MTFKPSRDDEYYIPLLVSKEEMQYVTNPDGTLDEQTICEEIEHYYDNDSQLLHPGRERSPAPSTLFPKPNTSLLV